MQISLENILGKNKEQGASVSNSIEESKEGSKKSSEAKTDFLNLLSKSLIINDENAGSEVDKILEKVISKGKNLEDVKEEFRNFKNEIQLSEILVDDTSDDKISKDENSILNLVKKSDLDLKQADTISSDKKLENIFKIDYSDNKNITKTNKILNLVDSKKSLARNVGNKKNEVSFADLMSSTNNKMNSSKINSNQLKSFYNNNGEGSIINFDSSKNKVSETVNNNFDHVINSNIASDNKGDLALLNSSKLGVVTSNNTVALNELEGAELSKVIEKVSDYIIQNNTASKSSINLAINHERLGQFNVNISKLNSSENINIEILAKSGEAHAFFVQNEKGLVQALTRSGLVVSGMKVGQSEEGMNLATESNSFSKEFSSSQKGNQGFYGGERQEDSQSQRRRELWEMYRERYGA